MKSFTKNSKFFRGAILGVLALTVIASPFSFLGEKGTYLNTAYAADPTCSGSNPPITPTSNPSMFAQGAAGAGASYACTSLPDIAGNVSIDYYNSDGTPYGVASDGLNANGSTASVDKTGKPITTTTDCAATLMYIVNFPTCLFRSFVTNTAALLIYAASWILTFAGALFNWLVQNTVVNFGSVYTTAVQGAVQSAWTAFRDIANILIIGIFAFIAISIILGISSKTFGQKRLIANVLIVAVLINFSLLFTKIIIDASNFTATQIYNAAALGTVSGTGQTTSADAGGTSATTGSSAGIGGQFIYLLGVQSLSDTRTALANIAQAQDNGWIAFFNGIFVFVIVIGAAAVLFYGSFLLVSRVILIMFLMVTASVAFASYLVPRWQSSSYGWDTWWSTLIRSAVFAPILMFFLWVTLTIGWALNGVRGSGSFGDMIANPTNVADTSVFVNYAVILGLLFISFKLSSTFASKISGFNFASMAAALPFTLGSRFIAAPLLRQTAGRAAGALRNSLTGSAQNATALSASARASASIQRQNGNLGLAGQAEREAERQKRKAATRAGLAGMFGNKADSKFNLMDTTAAKQALKAVGVSGFAAGASGGEKGLQSQIKAAAEAAEKKTPGISDKQKEEIRNEAVGSARETRDRDREQKRLAKENAEQLKGAISQVVEEQKRGLEQQKTAAEENLQQQRALQRENQENHDRVLEEIHNDGAKSDSQKTLEIELQKARRESMLRGESENITQAQDRVKEIQDKISNAHKTKRFDDGTEVVKPLEEATSALAEATSKLDEHDSKNAEEIKKLADKHYGEKLSNLESARSDVAGEIGRRELNVLQRVVDGDKVASATRGKIKSSKEKSSVLKLIEEQIKKDSSAPSGGGGH